MKSPVVNIQNFTLKFQHSTVLDELCWHINAGENWLLSGKSGSGKTVLAKAIAQLIPDYGAITTTIGLRSAIHYVANWYQFKDLEGQSNFYYQQRYNKQSVETTNTVGAELRYFGKKHQLDFDEVIPILTALNVNDLLSATLIQLSSGEHKKLQLLKALWLRPKLLILDLPYNGLDSASRKNLNHLLDGVATSGTQLILIANDTEIPSCINRFAKIEHGKIVESDEMQPRKFELLEVDRPLPEFLTVNNWPEPVGHLIKMIDVKVSYGDKIVLEDINWEVKPGEKWALQGPNGSGKSTLLSLICADHPQAFANNFYLFGNKRGSGESIWEIKERIGLISPELHWYFDPSATVWQSIVSGFYDSAGLFCEPGYTKSRQADELIDYFGLMPYKNTLVSQLPLGTQRLALLGRTIIKNPELLILDEPCQGLDTQQIIHFNKLVDELCKNGTTLIYVGHY
ncbi:MAG: ATP-binding cassette domain-containing protein, partial [Pedobacter sp.]|nr:ATP-binding cassette domain-containing protein [Pedobacter sp.]